MGRRTRRRKVRTPISSTYPPEARSFELKLQRAHTHLQEIKGEVQRWKDATLKSLREEPDSQDPRYQCAWVEAPPVNDAHLSILAGDCLQCMRSALDHLAFELAAAFTVPMTDQIEKDSEFPILSDVDRRGNFGVGPRKWRESGASKTGGMDLAAQAVIEKLQPYQRGHAFEQDPLWRLGLLNNIDKHRIVHVIGAVLEGATLPPVGWRNVASIGFPDNEAYEIYIAGEIAAEGRTLVARWPAMPIDPRKKMHVGFKPVIDIAFDFGTPLVGGSGVVTALYAMYDYILGYVLPPLRPFLK